MPFSPPFFRRLNARGTLLACLVAMVVVPGARGETVSPATRKPTLPASRDASAPVLQSLVRDDSLVLDVRKAPEHPRRLEARVHHHQHARYRVAPPIERPALAGVELLQPLPRPTAPPHIVVPLPAYGLDAIATAVTMPPPPVVCHPVRRDPTLPDPRLYRERTVVCEADNP